ncbi:MAG TPA: glycoside hydrolase family 15 protein [Burkholderiales bacterium]|nr:glycoside hydrolase family 15 protein [Burkholderiales bacterium]
MASRIEDYAMIGDCQTAALVARNGSIDWLCWPRFDSAACFAALLGSDDNGRWRISPADPEAKVRRRYRDGTLILETEFETSSGAVTVIDFMPVRESISDLVRLVVGRRGRVTMDMELALRFDYGASVPWVTRLPDGKNGIRAVAGPDMAVLRTPISLRGEGLKTRASFEVEAGTSVPFVLTHSPSHRDLPAPIDAAVALEKTTKFWRDWSGKSSAPGVWSEAVKRSLITLKGLIYEPTGGMVAAPTTSLPEQIGGVRNWDYRICWLRDATLTLLALMNAGYYDEAAAWREWLVRAVAGSPGQAQIMYGLAGERRLPEMTLGWLKGYEASAPVRIGNAASVQLQLDVYGEVMDALHQGRKGGLASYDAAWNVQRALTEHLEKIWSEPDEGLWEVRSGRRQFTYSKIMSWVAIDRAIKGVEMFGQKGPVERWRETRKRIHDDVCTHGFNSRLNSFVQDYGSSELDASLLLIPVTGFLPVDDPRVLGTVAAVQRHLMADGLVLRYSTHSARDGLPPGEGAFLACSFWLADNLALQERWDEATEMFERLLALRNDVGLLAEEYDPRARRMLGNFPQAFSHIALVNTAYNLAARDKPAVQRADEKSKMNESEDAKGKPGRRASAQG